MAKSSKPFTQTKNTMNQNQKDVINVYAVVIIDLAFTALVIYGIVSLIS